MGNYELTWSGFRILTTHIVVGASQLVMGSRTYALCSIENISRIRSSIGATREPNLA